MFIRTTISKIKIKYFKFINWSEWQIKYVTNFTTCFRFTSEATLGKSRLRAVIVIKNLLAVTFSIPT